MAPPTLPGASASVPVSDPASSSKPFTSSSNVIPKTEADDTAGMEGWGEVDRKKWRGLGLSDPIKSVEVRGVQMNFVSNYLC